MSRRWVQRSSPLYVTCNTDAELACYAVTARNELSLERERVDLLEEAKAERLVDLVKGSDDGMGEIFR